MVTTASAYVAPPAGPPTKYVAGIEHENDRIVLHRNASGYGYRFGEDAEGFGPADVENYSTPRLGGRGSQLGNQHEAAGDMILPIIITSTSTVEVRHLLAELTKLLRPANGTTRITLTNPDTGETRYRKVAYKDGLKTPVWASPYGEAYRITVEYYDPWAYSTTEEQVTLSVAPGASGGLHVPVRFPIRFSRTGGQRDRWGTNHGTNPAPVTLRFNGPVTDPETTLQGHWTFGIKGTLAWDEYLIVNPHDNTATIYSTTRADIARDANTMLAYSSTLTDLVVPPGQHGFSFRAIDPTYTATMTASWPHAHHAMY